jgi:hypothetical protein
VETLRINASPQISYSRDQALETWVRLVPTWVGVLLLQALLLPLVALANAVALLTGRFPRKVASTLGCYTRWTLMIASASCLIVPWREGFGSKQAGTWIEVQDLSGSVRRWRPVGSWLVVAPQLATIPIVLASVTIMVILAAFSIAFTQTYPDGLFDFNVRALAYCGRVTLYATGLPVDYPGFRL